MILSIVQLRLDEIMGGRQDAGTMDAARKLLVDTLARRPDLDLKNLSLTIGRNHAYLQQYLMRGSPRELPEAARHGLAALLGVSPDDLRSTVLPMGGRIDGDLRGAAPLRAAAVTCRSTPRPKAAAASSLSPANRWISFAVPSRSCRCATATPATSSATA